MNGLTTREEDHAIGVFGALDRRPVVLLSRLERACRILNDKDRYATGLFCAMRWAMVINRKYKAGTLRSLSKKLN